jgi:hypothetical protein
MQNDAKKCGSLQARIDRAATKLAALKAQQQAREARERARQGNEGRATRNRALVLWGVALEREALNAPEVISTIRALLEKHLAREGERAAAIAFLDTLKFSAPTFPAAAGNQNGISQL